MRSRRDFTLPENRLRECCPVPRTGSQRKVGIEQNRESGDSVFPVQCELPFQAFGLERPGFRLKRRPVSQIAPVVVTPEKTASHRGKLRELPVRRDSVRQIADLPRILPVPLIARPAVEAETETPADIRFFPTIIPADHHQRSGTRPQVRRGRCQGKSAETGKRERESARYGFSAFHGNREFRNRRTFPAVIIRQPDPDRCLIVFPGRIVKGKNGIGLFVSVIKGADGLKCQLGQSRLLRLSLRCKKDIVEKERSRFAIVPERDGAETILLRTDGKRKLELFPLCSDPEGPIPGRSAFCVLHPAGDGQIHWFFRLCRETQKLFRSVRNGNFADMQSGLL